MKKIFYRVDDGDTISKVAKRFNVPPFALIKQNNLTAEISCGDLLCVEILDRKTYTVDVGDTLLSIADRFNIPPNKLLEDNGVPYIFYGLTIYI